MSNLNNKLENIGKILANNGMQTNAVNAVKKEKKNDGLLEMDQSRKIVMHDNNRQVLTEWK